MEEGEGWWCALRDEAKLKVGADLWVLRRFGGHTTTPAPPPSRRRDARLDHLN
jgi:hypothetical protein